MEGGCVDRLLSAGAWHPDHGFVTHGGQDKSRSGDRRRGGRRWREKEEGRWNVEVPAGGPGAVQPLLGEAQY